MMSPKRTKYRKAHKGRIKGAAKGATALNFGSYGLKAVEPERVTARQIEAARRALTRFMKRQGRVWRRRVRPVFPRNACAHGFRQIHRAECHCDPPHN